MEVPLYKSDNESYALSKEKDRVTPLKEHKNEKLSLMVRGIGWTNNMLIVFLVGADIYRAILKLFFVSYTVLKGKCSKT